MLAVEAEGLAKRYAGLLGRGGHEALRGVGDTTITYSFTLTYTDANNDAPAAGYPKVYIGDADGMFAYAMALDSTAGATLRDGNYANGEQYVYSAKTGAASDIRYYFEAQAATGTTTLVTSPAGAPTSFSTVGVSLVLARIW